MAACASIRKETAATLLKMGRDNPQIIRVPSEKQKQSFGNEVSNRPQHEPSALLLFTICSTH
jgi:hypothetical protein